MSRYKRDFKRQLQRSHAVTLRVAQMFREDGLSVDVPDLRITPTWKDRGKYSDGGSDMTVNGLRMDVKGSYWNSRWHGAHEFPHELVYVCPQREFRRLQRGRQLPVAWIRTNWLADPTDYTADPSDVVTVLAGIRLGSFDRWQPVVSRTDRTDNVYQRDVYWACPRWLLVPRWGMVNLIRSVT